MRTAAFFDLDKTIIAKSSTLAFGRSFYQGGLINRRAVLKTAYAQFVYLAGGADHDQMERMRKYLSDMCTGWDVGQVREIVAETLHDLIDPLIYQEAADLIAQHKAAGRDVIIVSSSGAEVVEPIGQMVGARAGCAEEGVGDAPGALEKRIRGDPEDMQGGCGFDPEAGHRGDGLGTEYPLQYRRREELHQG